MKRLINIFFLAIIFCSTSSAYGIPSLESYGKLEKFSRVKISPNGKLIAFRQTKSDESDFLIVRSLKDGKNIGALDLKGMDLVDLYFANNNKIIIVGSKYLDWKNRHYTHNFDASMPFSFDFKKNELEPLMKLGEKVRGYGRIRTGQSGLGKIVGTSADGNILYIPSFITQYINDDAPKYELISVRVDGKGSPRLAGKGTVHTRDFFLDNDGKVIARENLNEQTNVHSIEVKEKLNWRMVYSYKSKIKTHNFIGLSDDPSKLIFSRNDDNAGYLQLSLTDGTVAKLKELKRGGKLMRDRKGTVVGVRVTALSPDYKMLDSKLHERIQGILAQFDQHSVYISDWTQDWKHIVVRAEGTLYAGDYFLFSEGEQPQFITASRPDIAQEDINPIGTVKYKASDGLIIPTILTLPKSANNNWKNLPTVVLPHGGPASHDKIGFDYMAQAFASRGYLVIQPQFRGSTGFGRDHREAGWGEWGKKMQSDLSDAVSAFTKKGYVDPERVCIVGASYGGYAALAGVSFTPDLYKCAVSIAGVSHLPKKLAASKSRRGRHSGVFDYWNRSILAGEYDKEKLKSVSPYFSAANIKAPVLLLHGEDDTVVEYEQSKLMHSAIKKAKGDVTLIKLEDDDHYLRGSATRIKSVKAMVEFVEKHIGS